MKKKKKTEARKRAEAAYNKERQRVKKQLYRMRQAGYRFDADFETPALSELADLSTNQLKGRTTKLKKLTPERLYKQSTFLDPETEEIVSGTEYRHRVRSRGAKKASEARRKRSPIAGPVIDEGEIIYRRIQEMIREAQGSSKREQLRAIDLQELLEQQITKYGRKQVLQSLANAPEEAIEDARVMIIYKDEDIANDARGALLELITGEVLSAQEWQKLDDQQDGTDFSADFQG